MGRRMKKFAMAYFPSAPLALLSAGGAFGARRSCLFGLYGLGADLHARLHFLQPFHDDLFARLQSRIDDPEIADAFAGFDHALLHRTIRLYDHDAVEPLNLLHRELGNQQGVFLEIGYESGFPILAWAQNALRIGKAKLPGQSARGSIHGALDRIETTFVGKDGAVRKDQLDAEFFLEGLIAIGAAPGES